MDSQRKQSLVVALYSIVLYMTTCSECCRVNVLYPHIVTNIHEEKYNKIIHSISLSFRTDLRVVTKHNLHRMSNSYVK